MNTILIEKFIEADDRNLEFAINHLNNLIKEISNENNLKINTSMEIFNCETYEILEKFDLMKLFNTLVILTNKFGNTILNYRLNLDTCLSEDCPKICENRTTLNFQICDQIEKFNKFNNKKLIDLEEIKEISIKEKFLKLFEIEDSVLKYIIIFSNCIFSDDEKDLLEIKLAKINSKKTYIHIFGVGNNVEEDYMRFITRNYKNTSFDYLPNLLEFFEDYIFTNIVNKKFINWYHKYNVAK
jgi:hypothetical protein